jgi:deazaflavin-dependent oxidoreductase (nitroreductase family)
MIPDRFPDMSMADFNQRVIDEFRESGGKSESFPGDSELLLLHHRGAKSGQERVTPLVYMPDGDRYVIFASKAGAPNNPAWYHNLKANPETVVEVGTETRPVTVAEVMGEERDRLYTAQAEAMPQFSEYAQKTDRVIPVLVLTPAG